MKNDKKKDKSTSAITKEDLQAIGNKEQHLRSDDGEDQTLIERNRKVDFVGKDLDVPGRTLPEDRNKKSLKDEENQLYSQSGEDNEDNQA